jgi:hypothetical protein
MADPGNATYTTPDGWPNLCEIRDVADLTRLAVEWVAVEWAALPSGPRSCLVEPGVDTAVRRGELSPPGLVPGSTAGLP